MLAAAATQRAVQRGDNLVVDGTLSNERNARRLLVDLAAAGYTVHLVDVEASREVVGERIDERWRAGRVAALAGTAGERDARLGGRWVPPSFADSLYVEGRPERSVCADIVRSLARQVPLRRVDAYGVRALDAAPEHVERLLTLPPMPGRQGRGPAPPTQDESAVRRAPGRPGRDRDELGRG